MIVGVLLAAGRGRRMGKTKQLLPWSEDATGKMRTMVESAYDAIAPACEEVIVVLGHDADQIAKALEPRIFQALRSDGDAEMIESIRIGLAAAQAIDSMDAVLLQPADHPEVAPETLDALLAEHARHPGLAIMPEHEGRGGHPVLIPVEMIPDILESQEAGGLRGYWLAHPSCCLRLELDDPLALRDVDDPEAYRREKPDPYK